ncbi:hypothetical protein [Maioricimonas sp. JC845]
MKIEEDPEGLLVQFQGIRDLVAGQKSGAEHAGHEEFALSCRRSGI